MSDPDRRQQPERRTSGIPRLNPGRRSSDQAQWLSISAYARLYGVHRNTAAKWVKLHAVEFYRKGKAVRIRNVPPDQQESPK